MAFQSNKDIFDFLRLNASNTSVSEAAPAVNFLLEERLSTGRENAFNHEGLPATAPVWDTANFLSAFGNHFSRNVGVSRLRPNACQTFAVVNQPALLTMESHRDVVRMESIAGLFELNKSIFDTSADLAIALRMLTEKGITALDADQRDQLQAWIDGANVIRDGRPMFVAPWGEVESILRDPAWANRLRDTMGLVHLGGTASAPLPIVLMRYNLSRSETAAQKARLTAWSAAPTVLEAGTHRGPNPAFFPFPPAAITAGELGFGQTVNLSNGSGLDYKSELLHFRIDYELADFNRVGEITNRIDDPQLATARNRHQSLLENDLSHRADLP